MTDVTISSIGANEVLKWSGSAWINQTLAEANILPVAGPTFTGVLTVGSAVISEADLEQIDDLTAGTAVASKALVVDSNKDIGTLRNLTIDGTFSDGNYTFDTSGNVSGLGTVASGTHTIGSLVVAAASITDTSGAITFGNENLSTTGTLAAGTTTIGTLTVAAASITDSSGALSFGNENLTTTGTLSAGVITGTGFTIGSAVIAEAELEMIDGITAGTAAASKAVVLDASTNITGIGTISAGAITSSGVITGTAFTAGSAVLTEAELEVLDAVTVGTAIASKVVTTDASIDTTGQRNLTITGELDAATGDFSGAVDIAGVLTMSGAKVDMSGEDIDNIRSATFITEVANGASGGTMTIDWGAGQKQSVVLSDDTAFTFTAPDGPCNLMLKVIHASNTTTYTPTWAGGSTNVDWPAATAPTFTQTSGSVDIVAFYYDGTNAQGTYYGQATLALG
jgi:hypothetical protein